MIRKFRALLWSGLSAIILLVLVPFLTFGKAFLTAILNPDFLQVRFTRSEVLFNGTVNIVAAVFIVAIAGGLLVYVVLRLRQIEDELAALKKSGEQNGEVRTSVNDPIFNPVFEDNHRIPSLADATIKRTDSLRGQLRDVCPLLERTNQDIADELGLAVRTVEGYVARIIATLDVENRSQALRIWLEENSGDHQQNN